MGRTLALVVCIPLLFCSGCIGRKEPTAPVSPQSAPEAPPEDLWDALPEPEIQLNPRWMRIEVRYQADGTHRPFVNGSETPADHEELLTAARNYSNAIVPEDDLQGWDDTGYSQNPVVFAAPPEASSRVFAQVMETLVEARTALIIVELATKVPRRLWQELPRDSSLGWAPDRRPFGLAVDAHAEAIEYRVFYSDNRPQVPDVALSTALVARGDSLDRHLFGRTWKGARRGVAELLLARQGFGESAARWVSLTFRHNGAYVPWYALFLALDAIDFSNRAPARAPRPPLAVNWVEPFGDLSDD